MTVKYSQFAQRPYLTIGTALAATGTVVAATANDQRIILNDMKYYLSPLVGTVTVTLALGSATMPAVALTTTRPDFTVPPYVLAQNSGIIATLSGSGTVGFWGRYLIATND